MSSKDGICDYCHSPAAGHGPWNHEPIFHDKIIDEVAARVAATAGEMSGPEFDGEDFLMRLASEGGSIVCTNALTPEQINAARSEGRMYVNEDGFGFVLTRGVTAEAAWLLPNDMEALKRFYETSEDSQPYDVPKDRMLRLAEIGVLQKHGGSRYSLTAFGQHVLDLLPEGWPRLPLKTHADHDAYTNAQIDAAAGVLGTVKERRDVLNRCGNCRVSGKLCDGTCAAPRPEGLTDAQYIADLEYEVRRMGLLLAESARGVNEDGRG
jgi:hypothetical protein